MLACIAATQNTSVVLLLLSIKNLMLQTVHNAFICVDILSKMKNILHKEPIFLKTLIHNIWL